MAIACQIKKTEEEDEDRVVTYKLSSQQQWERREWNGVREMVEGDFMGLGHKQLLFFPSHREEGMEGYLEVR